MIDPKLLRQSAAEVAANLARRGYAFDADAYLALDEQRKSNQQSKAEQKYILKQLPDDIVRESKKTASPIQTKSDQQMPLWSYYLGKVKEMSNHLTNQNML